MYIARFELGGEQWLQAGLRLNFCAASVSGTPWSKMLRHLVGGVIDASQLRFGYRVSLNGSGLERTLFMLARAEDETLLRRCLASFTRLSIVQDDSVQIPQSRQEYDPWSDLFPRYRVPVVVPAYKALGDLWVACDFNGRSLIDKLFTEAAARGHDLAYHANFEPLTVDPMLRREARKNATRIGLIAGAPRGLGEAQEELAKRLDTAAYLAEELFGLSSADGVDWLRGALRRYFAEAYEEWRLEPPDFPPDEELYELSLLAMRHRSAFEELSLQEICSTSVEEEDLQGLFSWCPNEEICTSLEASGRLVDIKSFPDEAKEISRVEWPAGTPEPVRDSARNYIFISYKRGDHLRISPILRRLAEWGYKIWYDRGIPGGSEWDAVLEERLEKCCLVIVFVSQKAIDSRYVRREVRFADTLKKAIVPVQLEAVELAHGMRMLLNELQLVDCFALEGMDQLKGAIQYALDRSKGSGPIR
ncbi:MAG: hypothetical protein DMF53_02390 [Acidobacteria bacterium]|nr:MAG: hypothetical protein DMF53_02390 [Acidobacteriota bacterium]